MIYLRLYGKLREEYGEGFNFDVKTLKEALVALKSNFSNVLTLLDEYKAFSFIVETEKENRNLRESEFNLALPDNCILHIIPEIEGEYGAATPIIQAIVTAVIKAVIAAAIQMALSYALQALLAPSTPVKDYDAREGQKSSFLFNGSVNRIEQVGPIPIVYGGPIMVGSVSISAGIDVEEIVG